MHLSLTREPNVQLEHINLPRKYFLIRLGKMHMSFLIEAGKIEAPYILSSALSFKNRNLHKAYNEEIMKKIYGIHL